MVMSTDPDYVNYGTEYKCSHDPTKGSIGMYHCPECGVMVLSGLPHPKVVNGVEYLIKE